MVEVLVWLNCVVLCYIVMKVFCSMFLVLLWLCNMCR